MTSVIAILNKRGAAIAADSAVTRTRRINNVDEEKVTKNGNKMVRISDAVPIAVMITGNAEFLGTPWDIIVRRYRQQRGTVTHKTVEQAVSDFFEYISTTPSFWDIGYCKFYVESLAWNLFNSVTSQMGRESDRSDEGRLLRSASFRNSFIRIAQRMIKEAHKRQGCPHFQDYGLDRFRDQANDILSAFFKRLDDDFPCKVLEAIRPAFEQLIYSTLSSRMGNDYSATLVFTGYGSEQQYPSMISALVSEGFDFRVNYSILPEDIICINDKRPVAICPFAQTDVSRAILTGIHTNCSNDVAKSLRTHLRPFSNPAFSSLDEDAPDREFYRMLAEVKTSDLFHRFVNKNRRLLDSNQRQWERVLKDCDLEPMASLANTLINLTGFHRVLTFCQESVGGTVDVAVISKNEGFTWLQRKNWYHKDGPLGI